MIIAVDGPSASGKGTLARRLAAALNLAYLDTGMIYRATAARILTAGQDPSDPEAARAAAESLGLKDLDRPDLRQEEVGQAASIVAAMPAVRAALLEMQRRFAAKPPAGKAGAVLDGRDIGTVVCPDADVKLFVTANLETRAARRHKELLERGEASIHARVVREMEARDARDSQRAAAPLKPAPDALVLDTSEMDVDTAFEAAMRIVAERRRAEPAQGRKSPRKSPK
jgi:cytidylate kinase